MSTEEKIKQAFERQAGRAGDHRKVLAEVRKATAKRRIGGWGTGLISIGVAAAVATPIILVSTGWMAEPGQRISLTIVRTDEVTDIALRVARSVKPDGDAAFVWPLEFTWLPQHLQPSGFSVSAPTRSRWMWARPHRLFRRHSSKASR